jgi:hypothetical protein
LASHHLRQRTRQRLAHHNIVGDASNNSPALFDTEIGIGPKGPANISSGECTVPKLDLKPHANPVTRGWDALSDLRHGRCGINVGDAAGVGCESHSKLAGDTADSIFVGLGPRSHNGNVGNTVDSTIPGLCCAQSQGNIASDTVAGCGDNPFAERCLQIRHVQTNILPQILHERCESECYGLGTGDGRGVPSDDLLDP